MAPCHECGGGGSPGGVWSRRIGSPPVRPSPATHNVLLVIGAGGLGSPINPPGVGKPPPPPPPSCHGANNAYHNRLREFLRVPYNIPHLWNACILHATVRRLVSWENPYGDFTMGEFELAVGVLHIALLDPHTTPLEHAHNRCNITTATSWKNRQSTTRLTVAVYLLHQHDLILRDLWHATVDRKSVV